MDTLLSSTWRFTDVAGRGGSPALRLLADGAVANYDHPNERGWTLLDGQVAFLTEAGTVSTVFDRAERTAEGAVRLSGPFRLVSGTGVTLVLEQVPPPARTSSLANLTRTAFANEIVHAGWEVGEHSYGVPSVLAMPPQRLVMGRYCSVASGVVMVASNHRTDTVSTYPFALLRADWPTVPPGAVDHAGRGDIVVGNDVWIGVHAFIASGVTIGDGAVVGAMSVVTRDVPPYAVVAGNPARVVRFRFAPELVEALLRIRWWDWPDAKVEAFLPLMASGDTARFVAAADWCATPIYRSHAPTSPAPGVP